MEMRIKAPGSRTFLQIIQARFDKKTHILYVVFALLTNATVTSMLLVGGIATVTYSFQSVSPEYAILLFIIAMSLNVLIGGLGLVLKIIIFSKMIFNLYLKFILAVFCIHRFLALFLFFWL